MPMIYNKRRLFGPGETGAPRHVTIYRVIIPDTASVVYHTLFTRRRLGTSDKPLFSLLSVTCTNTNDANDTDVVESYRATWAILTRDDLPVLKRSQSVPFHSVPLYVKETILEYYMDVWDVTRDDVPEAWRYIYDKAF